MKLDLDIGCRKSSRLAMERYMMSVVDAADIITNLCKKSEAQEIIDNTKGSKLTTMPFFIGEVRYQVTAVFCGGDEPLVHILKEFKE